MIFKILTLGLVIFFIYIVFFKKSRVKNINSTKKDNKADIIADEMMECPICKTFVSKDEAILSNGKYYCSQECLKNSTLI